MLVGPQQISGAAGLHAVALAKVAVGVCQRLVGAVHGLHGTHGRHPQRHALGAGGHDHLL